MKQRRLWPHPLSGI